MTWQITTYCTDFPDEREAVCRCGRKQSSDMLFSIANYTDDEKIARGWATDAAYICDSCYAMALRSGAITNHEFLAKQGAPSTLLDLVID